MPHNHPIAGGHGTDHLTVECRSDRARLLVVLVSGSGTNLQALLDACADPAYGATVVAVGADRDGIGGLDRAAGAGVPTFVVPGGATTPTGRTGTPRSPRRAPRTARTWSSPPGSSSWSGRPSWPSSAAGTSTRTTRCCPRSPGSTARATPSRYGVKVAGATLFFVDAGVDTGPIIAQVAVPVHDDDTEETLTERIKEAERRQLVEYVGRLVRDGWTITGRKVTIP